MKSLLYLFYFIFGLYIIVCILLYLLQEKIVFFPEKLPNDFEFRFAGDFEEKFFQVDDETTIHALHFFSENPEGVIIYFHGNAGSLRDWGHVADDFVKMNYDVLISDFRGYGKSTGGMSENSFYEDAQLLFDFLLAKYKAEEIIIYGRSLGTGVAVDLASKNKAKQLILETPFTSFVNLAKDRFKIFPVSLLLKYRFDSASKIKSVDYPIHIFHGTNDEVIPYAEATFLNRIIDRPDVLTTIPNGYHNNLPEYPMYWTKIKALLQ